jgi:hypothetical protein
MRRLQGLLAASFLLAVVPASAEVMVAVNDGRVDLTAQSAPLSDVLDRLARQTQMQVTYDGAPPRNLVTAAVASVTPAQAVLSVLEGLGVNYALQLDPTGSQVKTLLLIARASGPASAAATRPGVPEPPAARVPPPPPPPDEDEAMEEEDEPVEIRPDRPARLGRPGRDRQDRPGILEPNMPGQASPFPGGAPAPTPAYPVSPFAPTPPPLTVAPPVIVPPQPIAPENDPDS